jgi:SulP family sulfate permease
MARGARRLPTLMAATISTLSRWFLPSFDGYRAGWLRNDLPAGMAVAAVGLPSAIAYPAIAGLPPETGIYAAIAAALAYALFGPSRKLILGPDAATMSVLAAALAAVVAAIPDAGPAERLAAAGAIAMLAGVWCLLARLVGFDALANFLSRPILVGFFAGIALSIMIGQIERVTGLDIAADGLFPPLAELLREFASVHWPTVAFAAAAFALLQIAKIRPFRLPGPVVVVVLAIVLSWLFDLASHGIATVGTLPRGLPSIGLPTLAGLPLREIFVGSAAVFLVAFASGMVTARSFAARAGERVDPARELAGFGAANIAAGLAGAFPVTASDSRTAISIEAGARSQVAGVASALVLVATLLFLGPAIALLPVPALGAILVSAAIGMIDTSALRDVWRIDRHEFLFAMIAFAGAVSFGALDGIAVAVAATLLHVLRGNMRPRVALLGRVPGRGGFHKLHRNPDARPVPGLVLPIVEGSLLFYNADAIEKDVRRLTESALGATRWVVVDANTVAQIDVTGALALREAAGRLASLGVRFGIAGLHAAARVPLERAGVMEAIGREMDFATLEDALAAFRASTTATTGAEAASAEPRREAPVATVPREGDGA